MTRADRWTGMTKVIGALHEDVNAPKKYHIT